MNHLRMRQFHNTDTQHVVDCEWNKQHKAWVCSSDREAPFNLCAQTIVPIYAELHKAGFRELVQED